MTRIMRYINIEGKRCSGCTVNLRVHPVPSGKGTNHDDVEDVRNDDGSSQGLNLAKPDWLICFKFARCDVLDHLDCRLRGCRNTRQNASTESREEHGSKCI